MTHDKQINRAQCHSLPRKRSEPFRRGVPQRRSTGEAGPMEYFVPRSVSEFNLSGAGLGVELPHRPMPKRVDHGTTMHKPREKMVTFEDDKLMSQMTPIRKNLHVEDVFM